MSVTRMGGKNLPGTANVRAMLEEAKAEALERGITKCMVLFVKDDDENYANKFHNAGLKKSEMIALLEITKADVHELMRR